VTHEGDFLIHVIGLNIAGYWIDHAIGVVHPVEWNRRGQWRMRSDKRYKAEVWAIKVSPGNLLRCAISRPPLNSQLRRQWAPLRNVIHLGPFPHEVFEKVKLRMLLREPGSVAVLSACGSVVGFFAAQASFITKVFV
jgi:hypothetical protein